MVKFNCVEFVMGPLAVPDGFLGANACVIRRPRRNKSARLFCNRQRLLIYSHSTASLLSPLFLGFFLYLSYHYYLKIPLEKMEYQF